jgi:hypothetical protein
MRSMGLARRHRKNVDMPAHTVFARTGRFTGPSQMIPGQASLRPTHCSGDHGNERDSNTASQEVGNHDQRQPVEGEGHQEVRRSLQPCRLLRLLPSLLVRSSASSTTLRTRPMWSTLRPTRLRPMACTTSARLRRRRSGTRRRLRPPHRPLLKLLRPARLCLSRWPQCRRQPPPRRHQGHHSGWRGVGHAVCHGNGHGGRVQGRA